MIVNIFRPVYKGLIQINQYEVVYESRKNNLIAVEVAARNYASAIKFVEKKYNPRQVYSVCLIEDDIWRNNEGYSCIIWSERKPKRRWL